MLRKNHFMFLAAVMLFLAGTLAVFAQSAPLRGRVELKKGDGTTAPLADATVQPYRMDIKGSLPTTKTNKKGEFTFAGLPLGTLMIAVTAPGVQPQVFPNVRGGSEGFTLTVYEGDGKTLTEDEARALLNGAPKNNTAAASTTTAPPQNNEEAKKAQAELEKKNAEVVAKNEKITNANKIIDAAIKDGKTALDAKNYDVAVAKYEEGYQADPDFVGTAPIFLNNKAIALRLRAVDTYNAGLKMSDAAQKSEKVNAARKDFQDALDAYGKAYQLLKNAPAAEIKDPKNHQDNKYNSLSGMAEVYRLMGVTRMADSSKAKDAQATFTDYIAIETDAPKKARAQFVLADFLREAGDFESAVPEYRKALDASPDNPDVLAGLGLSLFALGEEKKDVALSQEGLNMMERFIKVAPETHPLKASVNDSVTYLKTERKLTPQKTAPAKKKT